MTTIDANCRVAELVQRVPGAARTFEQLGIDYCCRGKRTLREAVDEAKLELPAVSAMLEHNALEGPPAPDASDLPALVQHLLDKHHAFTRRELARLLPLASKVEGVHGSRHPELTRIRELVEALSADLLPHMLKEERVLFPYVLSLSDGERTRPLFGTVANPIRVMQNEHDHVGEVLATLERVTERYTPPSDACGSYVALFAGLKALQADIHEHVHLENNALFPAALALESGR